MTSMFKITRAGRFLLTGIFLLTLIFPAQALDVVNGNPNGQGSLREAVENGNDSVITVSPSVKTISLQNELTITRSVTINGNGAVIKGNGTARLFRITDGKAVFNELSFTGGNALDGSGGAVEIGSETAYAEFRNCNFYDNVAKDYGGAVSLTRGDTTKQTVFRYCTITKNSANYGGGIAVANGEAHIFSSIVTGNTGNSDIYAEETGIIRTRFNITGSTNSVVQLLLGKKA